MIPTEDWGLQLGCLPAEWSGPLEVRQFHSKYSGRGCQARRDGIVMQGKGENRGNNTNEKLLSSCEKKNSPMTRLLARAPRCFMSQATTYSLSLLSAPL